MVYFSGIIDVVIRITGAKMVKEAWVRLVLGVMEKGRGDGR
jgi:hypothetical protein